MVVFIADRAIGYLLHKLYFSVPKGQFAQTTYSIDSANQDVIILGSSRAIRHYNTSILSDKLHLSCYNAGRDAQFLPYYSAIEDVVFAKHTPKLLILDMNVWEFSPNSQKYDRLSIFLPYVQNHPELVPYIEEMGKWEKLKLYCHTYLYNSTLFIAMHDFLLGGSLPKDENGYLPLDRQMSKHDFDNYEQKKKLYDAKRAQEHIVLDQKAVKYFESMLDKARAKNVKVYVIISPTILSEPETEEKKLIGTIAQRYPNVTFLDYTHDTRYNNLYQKFADEFHLNKEGAEEYSKQLADTLKL
ncbi:SGNH/GDSL hydrolase family protein [Filimonas lacunae]|uniref:SGNH/GDSL hydrolase family protein n=1 Tax=Filimonas lacunae TaxID=477680 RepID=UPI001185DBDD|nr:SGNH/GDSL hydrolase family protein [Filimonas lacunae]